MRPYVFPALLIVMDLGAAVLWGVDGDWRRSVYWVAAAVLTYVVTF